MCFSTWRMSIKVNNELQLKVSAALRTAIGAWVGSSMMMYWTYWQNWTAFKRVDGARAMQAWSLMNEWLLERSFLKWLVLHDYLRSREAHKVIIASLKKEVVVQASTTTPLQSSLKLNMN